MTGRALHSEADYMAATRRHVVEDSLARYCAAMDDRDGVAAAVLLAEADLFFKDQLPMHGRAEIERFYAATFAVSTGRTAHLVSNVFVTATESSMSYSALYQRFSLDSSVPELLAIGRYSGTFSQFADSTVWIEHRVAGL
nr:nuclear transport factor 2 family protein [Rhodococcus sp. (in: high G+C Gram-positive bacteria)]